LLGLQSGSALLPFYYYVLRTPHILSHVICSRLKKNTYLSCRTPYSECTLTDRRRCPQPLPIVDLGVGCAFRVWSTTGQVRVPYSECTSNAEVDYWQWLRAPTSIRQSSTLLSPDLFFFFLFSFFSLSLFFPIPFGEGQCIPNQD
jgi:hypothetical protein